jgi:excisionase family DNA binding protein
MTTENRIIGVNECASMLNVGVGAIYKMCGRKEIPFRRCGKKLVFSTNAIMRWLEHEIEGGDKT